MAEKNPTAPDDELVTEVRLLNAKVASLSGDVQSLNDVQERRRVETLKIAADLRVETRRRTRRITVLLGAMVAALLVFGGIVVNGLRANSQAARSNESAIVANNGKFCPLITPFIPQRGQSGPTTENGRRITEAMRGLASDPSFHCLPVRP